MYYGRTLVRGTRRSDTLGTRRGEKLSEPCATGVCARGARSRQAGPADRRGGDASALTIENAFMNGTRCGVFGSHPPVARG